ncbi:MAG TPA: alkaline phosphatase family protein [Candidatus Angelobacter sp.]|nr:alkaline phosphatase family protein [Candidatus Angelobacter sp.]
MSMSRSMQTCGCAAVRTLFTLLIICLFVSVSSAQIPASQHVVLVIEENHNFSQVQSSMPWLVSEGNANGYATNYVAENGGSLKDYLWLASGSCHNASACTLPAGTHDFGCTGNSCTSAITDDNIFREMNARGISWKVYAQSYTAAGGTVTTADHANGTSYYRRHNGVTWYSDILSNLDANGGYPNLVDFTQFATDLANNALPQFSIIVPDGAHDAHDSCNDTVTPINCLQAADTFLNTNLSPMLSKSYFQPGGDGLLFVTFDECGDGVNSCNPNNIYTAVIGPKVVPGTASGVPYHHSSTLRTMLEALGITTFMGGAATANDLSAFFNPPGGDLLVDNFNSSFLDTTKWSNTLFTGTQNTSVAVSSNGTQLQIGPLPTNATSSSYNGITSAGRYNFTGADAYVQLVQPAAAGSNAFTMFAVGNDANNFYRFYVSGGSLVCEQKIGGTKSQVGSAAYNATTQQFLRIRHDANAGNVVWETAPNNSGTPGSWTQQCSEAWNTTAVPVTSVLFEMKAGTSVPESTAPGTILFDNFKAEKPALLTDSFGSGLDTTKWSNALFTGTQNTSVAVADTSGQLQIGPLPTNASSSSYNGITSLSRYDFTGVYAYVQLVHPAAANSNAFTMFAVGNDVNNFYRFYVSGGTLVCEKKIGGTKSQLGSTTYDSVAHQFLRIRHDNGSGNVVYETAPNNSGSPGAWTQQCSEAWNTTAVPVNSVLFELKAGTSVPEPNAPGIVIFDNFNAAKQ